jgi:hypothetical protein
MFAQVELNEKALKRFLRGQARALRGRVLEHERLHRVHLITGATGAFEEVFDGLAHFFGTKVVGIQCAIVQQIAAE